MSHPCHAYVKRLKERYESDAVAFVWGNFVPRLSRLQASVKWLNLIDSGKTIISLETPVIGRKHFEQCDRVEPFFRFGVWNSSTLHRGGFNIPPEATDARLTHVLRETDTEYTRTRSCGDSVLYTLQSPFDTSLQGIDAELAAAYDLIELKRHTDRPVIVVRHPYAKKPLDQIVGFCRHRGLKIVDGPASRYFDRAFCTVSHSSSTAIDGILQGVPAVTLNEGSFARPASVHRIADLEDCTLDGCHDWLCRLVFVQWQALTEAEQALSRLEII